jgi:hypothetical protein
MVIHTFNLPFISTKNIKKIVNLAVRAVLDAFSSFLTKSTIFFYFSGKIESQMGSLLILHQHKEYANLLF